MAADSNNLIWVDMEMSGLDPTIERVLEVAIVITDTQLNTVAEGPVIVVHQPAAVLDAMDAWNKSTHAKSGLIERVKASRLTEADADAQLVEFLKQHVPAGVSPLCGNSVHQDRRFMVKYLPAFEACIVEAKAESIMAAYNRTNGEPCSGSPTLLGKILRGEWGFGGYVVSDCWAIKDFHESHKVTTSWEESAADRKTHV